MTEAEWLACDDPAAMLWSLGDRPSERKLRLFACACCRRAWPLLAGTAQHLVETAEQFADEAAADAELIRAAVTTRHPMHEGGSWGLTRAYLSAVSSAEEDAFNAARMAAFYASQVPRRAWAREAPDPDEQVVQARLLRCVFGYPWRTAPLLAASLVDWFDGIVARLARAAYLERQIPSGDFDPGRLAVLADALEDDGCGHDALLSHLRSPGPHVRGCWAIDLILGKE
jgi:hypothetical protein